MQMPWAHYITSQVQEGSLGPALGVYNQPSSCSPWEGKCTVRRLNSGVLTSAVLGVGAAFHTNGSVMMLLSHGRTITAARNKTTSGNNPNNEAMLSIHCLHDRVRKPDAQALHLKLTTCGLFGAAAQDLYIIEGPQGGAKVSDVRDRRLQEHVKVANDERG